MLTLTIAKSGGIEYADTILMEENDQHTQIA